MSLKLIYTSLKTIVKDSHLCLRCKHRGRECLMSVVVPRGCLDNIDLLDLVNLQVDVIFGDSNVSAQRVGFCYHMPNRYLNINNQ